MKGRMSEKGRRDLSFFHGFELPNAGSKLSMASG